MFTLSNNRATALTVLLAASALALIALLRKTGCTQAAGLDVWNTRRLKTSFEDEMARCREITANEHRMWQRIANNNLIATRLLERELTLAQAVDELLEVAKRYPEWYSASRQSLSYMMPPNASSDRDVAAQLLMNRLDSMHIGSLAQGNKDRAAAIRQRMTELAVEIIPAEQDGGGLKFWRPLPGLADRPR